MGEDTITKEHRAYLAARALLEAHELEADLEVAALELYGPERDDDTNEAPLVQAWESLADAREHAADYLATIGSVIVCSNREMVLMYSIKCLPAYDDQHYGDYYEWVDEYIDDLREGLDEAGIDIDTDPRYANWNGGKYSDQATKMGYRVVATGVVVPVAYGNTYDEAITRAVGHAEVTINNRLKKWFEEDA